MTESEPLDLANRLKIVREKLKYSQREMSVAVDASLTSWQGYEAGKNIPGGNVLAALARMNFDVNWILTGEGEINRGEVPKVQVGGVDEELLEAAVDVSAELLESLGKQATSKQRTQLILALYDLANENEERKIDRPKALRLVKLMAA